MNTPCRMKHGNDWVNGVLLGFVTGEYTRVGPYYEHVQEKCTFAIVSVGGVLREVILQDVRV